VVDLDISGQGARSTMGSTSNVAVDVKGRVKVIVDDKADDPGGCSGRTSSVPKP
jgi:phosphoribosylpyrophosphate synthetase